jgi:hypothetical protein
MDQRTTDFSLDNGSCAQLYHHPRRVVWKKMASVHKKQTTQQDIFKKQQYSCGGTKQSPRRSFNSATGSTDVTSKKPAGPEKSQQGR